MSGKRTVYDVITDRIVQAIEGGTLPWRKTWRSRGGLPMSLNTGKAYRGINVFLTAMQGYENPYWLTKKQINQFGGSIKPGESSTPIVFWNWPTADQKAEAKAEGREVYPWCKYYKVWNVSQTTGVTHKRLTQWETAKAQAAEATEAEIIDGAEAIVNGWKSACAMSHTYERAFYNPISDAIGMPKAEAFESGAAYYCTLFHEMTHATGHPSRLKRFADTEGGACFGSKSYSEEELIAEMGASFLAAESGIDPELFLDNSAAYVAGWLKRLKGDSKLVMAAAGRAQRAADHILGREWKTA